MRTRFELADVVHRFAPSLQDRGKLTPLQQKVLAKIALCRTAALGGHEEACDNCGTVSHFIRISIVSSRLPDTPWMAGGKISVMGGSSFILFIR